MTLATRLPDDATIGGVRLRVRDAEAARPFYEGMLGLVPLDAGPSALSFSAGTSRSAFIRLAADEGTRYRPDSVFGIYHYAILFPDRASLANALLRLFAAQWPFTGFSDHGVSEAAYLDDPDGIGVELYADRPRERWPRRDGALSMYTRPLDLDNLLAESTDAGAAPSGTRIGHVHLHVRDLPASAAFYTDVLGLDSMAELPGARFLSAGGYHHHLGLNTWARHEPPHNAAGLVDWTFDVGADGLAASVRRLKKAGIAMEESAGAIRFADPDGNGIVLRQSG